LIIKVFEVGADISLPAASATATGVQNNPDKENNMQITSLTRALPLIASLMLAAPCAMAAEALPMSIPGGTYVDVAKAKTLFDQGTLFVDARVAAEYADQHIKGAVNIPYKETFPKESKTAASDAFDISKLPADKAKAMVFYCNGSPCWKGYKAAAVSIKAGYKHVYWLRDGMPGWAAKGYPAE
jgi:rhodanese-related sulfurtransferase